MDPPVIALLLNFMIAIFVTLKVLGVSPVSGWSWWAVTSPWWAPIAAGAFLYLLLHIANTLFMVYLRAIGHNVAAPFSRMYSEADNYKLKQIWWEWLFLTNNLVYSCSAALIQIFIRDRRV